VMPQKPPGQTPSGGRGAGQESHAFSGNPGQDLGRADRGHGQWVNVLVTEEVR
jgi:hypothetical protein